MHIDARTLEDGSLIEGDLCIVGAGAAGISMALEWINAGRKVVLLEGGGFDFEPQMQDLYRGDIVGLPYYPLHAARLHYFGGTTNHWAGMCSPYDPIDFEVRPWVPHSGWPITRADLDPFYERAQKVLELTPYYDYDADSWTRRDSTLVPFALDRRAFLTKMWQFSSPTRFGKRYRDAIVGASAVHLYTYANVCEIQANEAVSAVDELRVRTIEGKEHRVRAARYVLACCTIQNARLLLASNTRATSGLGNGHDLVGRHFMEHLEIPSGQLALAGTPIPSTALYMAGFRSATRVQGELAANAAMQRKQRMLNATVSVQNMVPGEEAKSTFQFFNPDLLDAMQRAQKGDTTAIKQVRKVFSAFAPSTAGTRLFNLHTRQEQAPNPLSRVTISRERDALGVPRAQLDWRLTDLDFHSFRAFYDVLGSELGRSGVGRARVQTWVTASDRQWPTTLSGGWHHMGTTRMHRDPKQGVVDPDCRVHGLGNLYVAGAAVFPTAGCANPTFTLVAMSLRLSDHLKTRLA